MYFFHCSKRLSSRTASGQQSFLIKVFSVVRIAFLVAALLACFSLPMAQAERAVGDSSAVQTDSQSASGLITSQTIAALKREKVADDFYYRIRQKSSGKYLVSYTQQAPVLRSSPRGLRFNVGLSDDGSGDAALWRFNPLSNECLYSLFNKQAVLPLNARNLNGTMDILFGHVEDVFYNPRFVFIRQASGGYLIMGDVFLKYLTAGADGIVAFTETSDTGAAMEWEFEKVGSTVQEGEIKVDGGPLSAPFLEEEGSSIESFLTDYQPPVSSAMINGFVHPGILLTKNDMERIRSHVRAGHEPWASAFRKLAGRASLKAKPGGSRDSDYEEIITSSRNLAIYMDGSKVAEQAYMWFITGDERYRANALNIIRAWSHLRKANTREMILRLAPATQKFCMAAEILKYTESRVPQNAWTAEDETQFLKFLETAGTAYSDAGMFFNQHAIGNTGMMGSAIYRSHVADYARAVQRTTTNPENLKPQSGAIAGAIRVMTKNELTGETLISPVTQLMEMGRDQTHPWANVGALATCAMMTVKQGTVVDPVSGIVTADAKRGVGVFEFLDDRLLYAANALAKYNLGYNVPYVSALYKVDGSRSLYYHTIHDDFRGHMPPAMGAIYGYYKYLQKRDMSGEDARYLEKAYQMAPLEGSSYDYSGWGQLFYTGEAGKVSTPEKKDPRRVDFLGKLWHFSNFTALLEGSAEIAEEKDTVYATVATGQGPVVLALMNRSATSPKAVNVHLRLRTHAKARISLRNSNLSHAPFVDISVPDTAGKWVIVQSPVTVPESYTGSPARGIPANDLPILHQAPPPLYASVSSSRDVDLDYVELFDP